MSDKDSDVPTDGEANADEDGKCFVIAPIGSGDTDTRNRTDDLMNYVIRPVVGGEFGLDVEIAHDIDEPGNITRQVMELLFEADLVIADLTEHNPNVMYELAVRHAVGEPVVTIAKEGTTPPFDIGPQRTKFYELEFGGAEKFKGTLRSAVAEALREDHEPDNPIQQVRKGFTLSKVLEGAIDSLASEGEEGKELAGVLHQMVDKMEDLEAKVERPSTRRSKDPESKADGASVPGGGLTGISQLSGRSDPKNPLMRFLNGPPPSGTKIGLTEPESPFDSLEHTAELVRRLQSDPRITDASFSEDEQGNLKLKVFHDPEVMDNEIVNLLHSKAEEVAGTTGE